MNMDKDPTGKAIEIERKGVNMRRSRRASIQQGLERPARGLGHWLNVQKVFVAVDKRCFYLEARDSIKSYGGVLWISMNVFHSAS